VPPPPGAESRADPRGATPAAAQQSEEDAELQALLQEVREEADLLRRRGNFDQARRDLQGLLAEEPDDWRTRAYLARLDYDAGDFEAVRRSADGLRAELLPGDPATLTLLEAELLERAETARGAGLGTLVEAARELGFDPAGEPRLGWPLGELYLELGRRTEAEELFAANRALTPTDWRSLLGRARAERFAGDLTRASHTLVAAAESGGEGEAELLAELAAIYFEADGEGQRGAGNRPAGQLLREALDRNPRCEAALLELHALGRVNWRRQSRAASEYVQELLDQRPHSVRGQLAAAHLELELGRLPEVRQLLAELQDSAPRARAVRTLDAALAWVEHRRDDARALLTALAADDARDGAPERQVGTSLVELYRFEEGREFLAAAVERDPRDHRAWTQLGRALANTGDVEGGLAALDRAREEARGRHDVWRENTRQVLRRVVDQFVEEQHGPLTFAWDPLGAQVLSTYWVPFYTAAREELAARYGYTSGPVRIEVFDRHADFSVRSTGFEGFPALGVCFGPVVTAVSPRSELRGSFAWSRTSYHEFTHVVHLGLSNNRCPRWITEGLATWEEERVNRAWGRNMRRELLDARANGEVFPLRELNGAFRGPRILFGYYQGGLLCRMLIADHGFAALIRFLEAFDRGLDLDRACAEVFGTDPDQIDRRFAAFVDRELEGLAIEPRWNPSVATALRLSLDEEPPADPAQRLLWQDDWVTVATAALQQGQRVDAALALRRGEGQGEPPLRALALRGQMAFADDRPEEAEAAWERFLERGGEDFFVRLALADLAWNRDRDLDRAEGHLLAAERAFPGFAEQPLSAELGLARLYEARGDRDASLAAKQRWLDYNSGEGPMRLEVAAWHRSQGRLVEAERLLDEANQVDPFRAQLHRTWGDVLRELGRLDTALREYDVALAVPPELDADGPQVLDAVLRGELHASAAEVLAELGRAEEARARAAQALAADPANRRAEALLTR
jgi:predicted Zn-dependent protease